MGFTAGNHDLTRRNATATLVDMRTMMGFVMCIASAACATDGANPFGVGSDAGSGNSVQQKCGLSPPAPGIAYEATIGVDGGRVIVMPADQFAAFNEWATQSMEDWTLCALNDVM